MAWILWYPYKCEIICRKPRHHDKLRKREFLYVRNWNPRQAERRRDPENTAKTMGSGTLNVFATPALVALAEKTCWMSVADALDEGCGSVGTKLELEHTAPTPVGMTVTCESELTAVEGRKLVFKVSLYDEKGPVGGGVHERFVVNDAKFAAKAESKKG